ncbi:hypothetical protein EMIHUDRAFT_206831 [Emiliania huxleyi CCMP1516]|uniref:Amino acid transporter transmembrane domain-containing protein n=2 Tax=Emiliania huxleyi TaxID=2903 RepID=A0A0D3JMJ0_EMIH1|nr:hypothetical protein EMIHUDRAFT_248497 [Emiliania huxleyi CCMP1516]XP_005777154.1 hypothetical protein EMIHUDRAFT_206831 [Emiliania huxleyi CCMP1516]EOD10150.1 hypothetical protein EMIHUDRAFT_248497 [Emiliania huxleyi CCMP1516]EOD24725.1 hypothetical protein EMIHUDRAFT_206831 [Emiliania huxleyi CCMP1516]|eukprot:XP_005762579.1 hypothetical protein EMIHUDRAFT_248497 [Emiliania huxleyi CCMP1516]
MTAVLLLPIAALPLKAKQNKVASIVGVAYFSQFGVILAAALARLGLLKPPPFNSLTNIANAEMERAVAAGDVPPLMATVYAQQFWIGLVADYFAGGQDDAFLPQWCADHITLCASAGLTNV